MNEKMLVTLPMKNFSYSFCLPTFLLSNINNFSFQEFCIIRLQRTLITNKSNSIFFYLNVLPTYNKADSHKWRKLVFSNTYYF